jgi:hypothetical protein
MRGKIKKYLKITVYTFLTLSILIFISGILVFSNPFFLNAHVNFLVKHSGADPQEFEFQTYTKEEFALKYLNVSLGPDDDLIELFESKYGTSNKKDELLMVTYDIPNPEDNSTFTLYGINKYADYVYVSTRKAHPLEERRGRALQKDMNPPADQEGNQGL